MIRKSTTKLKVQLVSQIMDAKCNYSNGVESSYFILGIPHILVNWVALI